MYYYQLAFNRPLRSTYTYASEQELSIGSRVKARLHSVALPAVIVSKEDDKKVKELQDKNIHIKTIEQNTKDKGYAQRVYTAELIALAQWMSDYYVCSLGQCLFTLISATGTKAKELTFSKKLISYFPKDFPRLTDDQQKALVSISTSIDANASEYVYLHGVTGSGKTEVYLQSMQHAIRQGKQVIYLLPEIALLEQVLPLIVFRFGEENVAVLHSRLSAAQKLYQWNRILHTETSIVVGVRSAIFAPCNRLGLIIIDEENDSSYKSDKAPRYHARQVAMWRSKKAKALLLMGSATPSLESWYNIQEKNIRCISLSKRISSTGFPTVKVVSLRGSTHAISEELEKAIQHSLSLDKQVILLVNKRGFSHAFLCDNCGTYFECPNCSVSLVSHRSKKRFLLCHHCGYSMDEPELCPSCGYTALSLRGWGTQRVEHEIHKLFPRENIVRIDSDSTKKKGQSTQLLLDFYHKQYSIMIGTQMIAKGINIPNLHLVGILFCDSLFTLPDFRAYEKAYALLEQATGRASRFSEKGHVIIQSYAEDKSFLQHFINRDQVAFYKEELQKRKQYNLVPFCRMLRLVFRGINEEAVVSTANTCANILSSKVSTISFLGPAPCALYKLSKNYRMHIILYARSQKQLLHISRTVLLPNISDIALKNKVHIEIDPDPMNVM